MEQHWKPLIALAANEGEKKLCNFIYVAPNYKKMYYYFMRLYFVFYLSNDILYSTFKV